MVYLSLWQSWMGLLRGLGTAGLALGPGLGGSLRISIWSPPPVRTVTRVLEPPCKAGMTCREHLALPPYSSDEESKAHRAGPAAKRDLAKTRTQVLWTMASVCLCVCVYARARVHACPCHLPSSSALPRPPSPLSPVWPSMHTDSSAQNSLLNLSGAGKLLPVFQSFPTSQTSQPGDRAGPAAAVLGDQCQADNHSSGESCLLAAGGTNSQEWEDGMGWV